MMKTLLLAGAALAATVACGGGDTSDPVRVFTSPDTTPFWRTATSSSMTLRWEFPEGASSADLTVAGMHSTWSWTGLSTTSQALVLPEPTSPATEDVYWLTLAFDNGVTNKAQVAVVRGVGTNEGSTVCKTHSGRRYLHTSGSEVLPIPYGATSLSINGEPIETGLDGAMGWYGWNPSGIGSYTLSLVSPDFSGSVDVRVGGGLILLFR